MAARSPKTPTLDDHSATGEGAQPTEGELYRIEQVSELTGLTKRTLRYYEERGLLDPPTRTDGNYRLYSPADVEHIKRVRHMRESLGASLAEIKEMVEGEEARQKFRDAWRQSVDPASRLTLLDEGEQVVRRQLEVVQRRLSELSDLEHALRTKLDQYGLRRTELRQQLDPPTS